MDRAASEISLTIRFEDGDDGWITAQVVEIPGAISQGRTRGEARENVIDALRTVLTPDEQLAGSSVSADNELLVLAVS
jgi:predicted RNase H-like HicB family nuclease